MEKSKKRKNRKNCNNSEEIEQQLKTQPYLYGLRPGLQDYITFMRLQNKPPDEKKYPLFYNWFRIVRLFAPETQLHWKQFIGSNDEDEGESIGVPPGKKKAIYCPSTKMIHLCVHGKGRYLLENGHFIMNGAIATRAFEKGKVYLKIHGANGALHVDD